MNDPYKVLGVSRNATDDEIKKAYRTLSKKYHPDANVGSPHLAEYEEMFKRVQNAYDQIMDERKHGGANGSYWQQSSAGGFGGFGGYQNPYGNASSSYSNNNTDLQAAVNFINSGHYQEAYNVLQRMEDRGADWYYLSALALWGLGNQIAAVENIKKACEMDPSNQQYRAMLQQMQGGRMNYQRMQSPFGSARMNPAQCCCQLMCLSAFMRGCPIFCCI